MRTVSHLGPRRFPAKMNEFAGVDGWQSRRIGKPKSKIKILFCLKGTVLSFQLPDKEDDIIRYFFTCSDCYILGATSATSCGKRNRTGDFKWASPPNPVVVPGDSNLFCWDSDISNGGDLRSFHLLPLNETIGNFPCNETHFQNVPGVRDILSLVIHLFPYYAFHVCVSLQRTLPLPPI